MKARRHNDMRLGLEAVIVVLVSAIIYLSVLSVIVLSFVSFLTTH